MTDGKLAIVMPTHRYDATACNNINVLSMMSSDDIQIYIGDNSCNREKWSFLKDIAAKNKNFHAFMHEENIGGERNWLFLLHQQDHEFVCMASDDDFFTPDYFLAGYDELRANPACAVASGLFVFMTPAANGRFSARQVPSNAAPSASERVRKCDSIPYAVFRQSNLGRFSKYLEDRPFIPAYMDQIHTYNMLAQGTFVADLTRRLFLYDNHNWSDDLEFDTSAGFYAQSGLTKDFQYLHHLSWAVDAAHFFFSTYRPSSMNDKEAAEIVDVIFHEKMTAFRTQYAAQKSDFEQIFESRPDGRKALLAILKSSHRDPVKFFENFVRILRSFNPAVAERYDLFVKQSLHPSFSSDLAPSLLARLGRYLSFSSEKQAMR